MTHALLGHTTMAHTKTVDSRRETKSERKQYKFKPSLVESIDQYVVARKDFSENEIAEMAIAKEIKSIPLLGEIYCGPLTEVPEEQIEDWVNVGDLLPVQKGDFLLRSRGDSMTGDGIYEGDLILIRPTDSCDSGEIAAVLIDTPMGTRATLKKIVYEPNTSVVKLVPMNEKHKTIEVDLKKEKLRICGVKRGVIRLH